MSHQVIISEGFSEIHTLFLQEAFVLFLQNLYSKKFVLSHISRHADNVTLQQCCTQFLTPCNTSRKLLLKTCKAVHKEMACVLVLQGEIDCIIWLID